MGHEVRIVHNESSRRWLLWFWVLFGLLIIPPIARVVWIVVAITDFRYHTFLQAEARNRTASVRVQERCGLPDCAVAVVFDSAMTHTILVEHLDCSPGFAHVAWADDSETVAVYVRDGLCGETWINFDVTQRRFLPFNYVATSLLEQSVRRQYTSEADPHVDLDWMRTPRADEVFARTVRKRD